MKVKMQQRRASCFDRRLEGTLDGLDIVEVRGIPHVDDQVAAGVAETIPDDEMVLLFVTPVAFRKREGYGSYLCSGADRLRFSIHRDLTSERHLGTSLKPALNPKGVNPHLCRPPSGGQRGENRYSSRRVKDLIPRTEKNSVKGR